MSNFASNEADMDSIYLAGELVPAGLYQRIGTTQSIRLDDQDYLPASLDGRVACYVRVFPYWAQAEEHRGIGVIESLPVAA